MSYFISTQTINISLPQAEQDILREKINLEYLGTKNCNKRVNNKLVAKYPEKETEKFKNLHSAISASRAIQIKVFFDKELNIFQIEKA